MGAYNLVLNNCQHFCDNFLNKIGLLGHTTDTAKIGFGSLLLAGVVGIGAIVIGVARAFSSNNDDSDSEEDE